LLLAGQPGEAVGEGVGNAKFHFRKDQTVLCKISALNLDDCIAYIDFV
jgi:hypothetical protein